MYRSVYTAYNNIKKLKGTLIKTEKINYDFYIFYYCSN